MTARGDIFQKKKKGKERGKKREGRRRTRSGVELKAPAAAMATADPTRTFMKDVKRVIIKVIGSSEQSVCNFWEYLSSWF